jgi:hypothetical protein
MLKRALTLFLLVLALAAGQVAPPAAAVESLVMSPMTTRKWPPP